MQTIRSLSSRIGTQLPGTVANNVLRVPYLLSQETRDERL